MGSSPTSRIPGIQPPLHLHQPFGKPLTQPRHVGQHLGAEGAALGAVLVVPTGAALLIASYQGQRRTIAFSFLGAFLAGATAATPMIMGTITKFIGWRFGYGLSAVVAVVVLRVGAVVGLAARARSAAGARDLSAALAATGRAASGGAA